MITVIDYGGGNLKSVTNLLEVLDCKYQITSDFDLIANAEKIIFPGQGHFGQSMQSIRAKNLDKAIIDSINDGIPFLGICVGLQVLFEESEEAPDVQGLGIIKGKVIKFTQGKVPQIGWNKLKITPKNTILSDDYYYFVNSYYVKPDDESLISSYANYHKDFAASIEYKNLTALQFHPEKSGEAGFNSIKKWVIKPI